MKVMVTQEFRKVGYRNPERRGSGDFRVFGPNRGTGQHQIDLWSNILCVKIRRIRNFRGLEK